MLFHNFTASRVPLSVIQWFSPTPDGTVPLDEAAMRVYVRQADTSFKRTNICNDQKTADHFKHFLAGASYYQLFHNEACSWRIVVRPRFLFVNTSY